MYTCKIYMAKRYMLMKRTLMRHISCEIHASIRYTLIRCTSKIHNGDDEVVEVLMSIHVLIFVLVRYGQRGLAEKWSRVIPDTRTRYRIVNRLGFYILSPVNNQSPLCCPTAFRMQSSTTRSYAY